MGLVVLETAFQHKRPDAPTGAEEEFYLPQDGRD